jgi:hypothetical protein
VAYEGFVNLTPFAAEPLLLSDERGGDAFTCVVKATLSLSQYRGGWAVAVAEEQVPVCLKPVHYSEPALSSIKYDCDAVLTKPGTDVVLIGHAYAPEVGARYADVSLSVGQARSVVRVFGDRVWRSSLGRWAATVPEPFEAVPLVYERAFGGWDRTNADPARHEFEPRNPVGVGFVSKKHGVVREGLPLPNVENPYELIASPADRPAPVGFGFVAPHWQPRVAYAGTYDERWKTHRMPLLPDDFNRHFYSAAHPALIVAGFLAGGEAVEIINASRRGTMRFTLPVVRPYITVKTVDGAVQRLGAALDTVIFEPDQDRLFLIWRGSVSIHKRTHDIAWAKAQLAGDGVSLQ